MRIAIIGQSGQLARALIQQCANSSITATSYDRSALDLTADSEEIERFIDNLETDGVIIAAAYTAVDQAETDEATVFAVNAEAPAAIARACARRDISLVHVSTDYVFQGKADTPYTVEAPTQPINAYGRSKLAGEEAVIGAQARAAVLRTSWVYDGSGKNFMTTMLRLAQTRSELNVVADQIGRPTFTRHLADACLAVMKDLQSDESSTVRGIYHVTNSGPPISWADFAAAIFERAHEHLPHHMQVSPIPSRDYPTPAKRPAYSVLDLAKFESRFGALPHWREGLEQALKDWSEHAKK